MSSRVLESLRVFGLRGEESSWQMALAALEATCGSDVVVAEFWRDLLGGRWSLQGWFKHGRRCFFVISANGREAARRRALAPQELAVWLAEAAGASNKGIASTLGISQSAVTQYLRRARAKLGGRASLDLLRSLLPVPSFRAQGDTAGQHRPISRESACRRERDTRRS